MDQESAVKALETIGDIAMAVYARGGALGAPALVIASILKTAASAMRQHGHTVDDILAKIRMPRRLNMPWNHDAQEDTAQETPGAKHQKE